MGGSSPSVSYDPRSLDKELNNVTGWIGNLASEIANESMPKIAGSSANLQMQYNPKLYESQVNSLVDQLGSSAGSINTILGRLNPLIAGAQLGNRPIADKGHIDWLKQNISKHQQWLNDINARKIGSKEAPTQAEKDKDIRNQTAERDKYQKQLDDYLKKINAPVEIDPNSALGRANTVSKRLTEASAPLANISQLYSKWVNRDTSQRDSQVNAAIGAFQNYAKQAGSIAQEIGKIDIDKLLGSSIGASETLTRGALADYKLGGQLSNQEYHRAEQAIRSSWADRGMAASNPTIFAEALNRDYLQNERLQTRTGNLIGAIGTQSQLAGQRYSGKLGIEQAVLQALGLVPQSLQAGASFGLQADQIRGNELSQAGQFFGGLATQAQNANATNYNIQSSFANNAMAAITGQAIGTQPYVPSSGVAGGIAAQPLLGYSNSLYGSNLEAQVTANAAEARAASSGSGGGGIGSILGGIGSGIAGGLGASALGGAAGGSSSAGIIAGIASLLGAFCWVARECLGTDTDDWKIFRHWMLYESPKWFKNLYCKHGEKFAEWLHKGGFVRDIIKKAIAVWMRTIVNSQKEKYCYAD